MQKGGYNTCCVTTALDSRYYAFLRCYALLHCNAFPIRLCAFPYLFAYQFSYLKLSFKKSGTPYGEITILYAQVDNISVMSGRVFLG